MKLLKEVSEKYQLKTIRPGKYHFPDFGLIDLSKITIHEADELVDKGFPFLVKKKINIKHIEPVVKKNKKPKTPEFVPIDKLRKNKMFINNLLSMDWGDLSYQNKLIFNNSEAYFIEKKSLFISNSHKNREMRSLHSKIKTINPDSKNNEKRKNIIQKIAKLDDEIFQNWQMIDNWEENKNKKSSIKESEIKKAVEKALERDKKIRTHKSYIYRAEKTLPNMKSETKKQRDKIERKKKKIERYKMELEKEGIHYE